MLCDTLAGVRSWVNMPTLLCSAKLLSGFDGWDGACLDTAQANVFRSVGRREPPVHLLHPEQTTSTAQCVELTDDDRVV